MTARTSSLHLLSEPELLELVHSTGDAAARQLMIERGMSLRQIQAARPTLDYDTEYVKDGSFVTAAEFVEAVHRSLTEQAP